MPTEVFIINKGVNRPVVFRGLQAQYIGWLAGGVVTLLVGFAVLYLLGLNPFACVGLVLVAGTILFRQVYHLNRKYGRHGLMKRAAAKRLPACSRITTQRCFQFKTAGHVNK